MILDSKLYIFKNVYFDVLLSTSFLLFLFAFILLVKINRLRLTYRLIAKTNDLITDIRTSPIADKIMHVEFIVADNGNLEKEFLTWWTIFELVYEVKFRQIAIEFYDLIFDKKMKFSRKNYKKINNIYLNLRENIYSVNLMLIDDINKTLRYERLYRNFFVKFNNLYLKLLLNLFQQNYFGDLEYGNHIENIKSAINNEFSNFYKIMDEGKWQALKAPTDELKKYLEHLIYVIDYIPYFKNENEVVIQRRMATLKNEHITFHKRGLNNNISGRVEKFAELEIEVEKRRRDLQKQINNFQYLKASKTYDEIYQLIYNYENYANYEEGIQQKLKYFSEGITDILNKSDQNINMLMKKIRDNIDTRSLSFDFFEFQKEANEITALKDDWILTLSSIDGNNRGKVADFNKLKKETEIILKSFIKKSSYINKCEKEINKDQNSKSEILNQLIVIESWIDQCDIKISKYYSVKSLRNLSDSRTYELRENLNIIKSEVLKTQSQTELEQVNKEINSLVQKINSTWQSINEQIFFDFISQELIVYITRFKDNNDNYEKFINNCIIFREEGKFKEVIDNMLKIIPELKRNRG